MEQLLAFFVISVGSKVSIVEKLRHLWTTVVEYSEIIELIEAIITCVSNYFSELNVLLKTVVQTHQFQD